MAKTSIYLPPELHRDLRLAAADVGVKLNDLFVAGVTQFLNPSADRDERVLDLDAELQLLREQALNDAAERDRLTAQIRDVHALLDKPKRTGLYLKGDDRAAALVFWDMVMDDAAWLIRTKGAPMTPAEILPTMSLSLKVEAALGGQAISVSLLKKKMKMKADHAQFFIAEADDSFRLLDGWYEPQSR